MWGKKVLSNLFVKVIYMSQKRCCVAWGGLNWFAITRLQSSNGSLRETRAQRGSSRGVETVYKAVGSRKASEYCTAVLRSGGRLRSEVYAPGTGKVERDVYNTWLKQPWLRDFHGCLPTAETTRLIFNHGLMLKEVEKLKKKVADLKRWFN